MGVSSNTRASKPKLFFIYSFLRERFAQMKGKLKIGEYFFFLNEASLDLFIYLHNLDMFGRRVLICVIIFVRICVIIGSAKTCKQMNLDLFG